MRCLTLADMLRKEEYEVIFLCRDLPGNLVNFIEERSYKCTLLTYSDQQKNEYLELHTNDDYNLWRGVSIDQDSKETIDIIKDQDVDLLVIDHYGIDLGWKENLKPYCEKNYVNR